ncbi:FG-GAP-like repeat-containing protein [Lewinella sp. W8]|uniref:FG-GAP-like repeat-containing protein n=1 Tax=Lewinella sp. W8 TaxID=2528208 RepID=UPI001067FDF3|nr:FG-GAP-like repeat-containing protein [Lewinella sp. W8]MTB50057.1 hypothetical protein [Lewinella sp. W8]
MVFIFFCSKKINPVSLPCWCDRQLIENSITMKRIKALPSFATLVLIICFSTIYSQSERSDYTGFSPGEVQVTPTGDFLYSGTVLLPVGTFQPKIDYGVSGREGLPILRGLPKISLRAQHPALGENNRALSLDATARFSLNGTPLLGIGGNELRAIDQPWEVIRSHRRLPSGLPEYFTLKTQEGTTLYFGKTEDSRIEPQGSTAPVEWLINRVVDKNGNYYTVSYLEKGGHGYPLQIDYAGNERTGKTPQYSVRFKYTDYFHPTTYIGTYIRRKTQQLAEISCFHGTEKVRSYRFSYKLHGQASQLVVHRVQEFGKNERALAPTDFNYNTTAGQVFRKQYDNPIPDFEGHDAKNTIQVTPTQADLDGIQDFAYIRREPETDGIFLRVLRTSPNFKSQARSSISMLYAQNPLFNSSSVSETEKLARVAFNKRLHKDFNKDGASLVSGDVTGDGRDDLIALTKGRLEVYVNVSTNNQVNYQLAFFSTLSGDLKEARAVLGDFNGDRLLDILLHRKDHGKVLLAEVGTSGQVGFRSHPDVLSLNVAEGFIEGDFINFTVGDYDADGQSDLLVFKKKQAGFLLFDDHTNQFNKFIDLSERMNGQNTIRHLTPTDVNSDGYTDLVEVYHEYCEDDHRVYYQLHRNTGKWRFVKGGRILDHHYYPNTVNTPFFTDLNNDGYDDLVVAGKAGDLTCTPNASGFVVTLTNAAYVFYNDRKGSFADTSRVILLETVGPARGRIEDGEIDLKLGRFQSALSLDILTQQREGSGHTFHELYAEPTLLTSVTEGNGGTTEITYQNALEPAVCKMTSRAVEDPSLVKTAVPIHVVSHLKRPTVTGGHEYLSYQYRDPMSSRDWGFKGFSSRIVRNHQTSSTEETEYRHFPGFAGSTIQKKSIRLSDQLTRQEEFNHLVVDHPELKSFSILEVDHKITTNDPYTGSFLSQKSTHHDYLNNELPKTTTTRWSDGKQENTSFEYNSQRRIKSLLREVTAPGKDTLRRMTIYGYDDSGNLDHEILDPDNPYLRREVSKEFNNYGKVESQSTTGWAGPGSGTQTRTVTQEYDNHQLLSSVTDAAGYTTHFKRDPVSGKVLERSAPNGLVTTYEFDEFYRSTGHRTGDHRWVKQEHSLMEEQYIYGVPVAYRLVEKDAKGRETVSYFNLADQVLRKETLSFGGRVSVEDTQYDGRGRKTQASYPYWSGEEPLWTTFRYDLADRLVGVRHPDGTEVNYLYDRLQMTVTDEEGKQTVYRRDIHGNDRSVTNAAGVTTVMTYDVSNNRTSIGLEDQESRAVFHYTPRNLLDCTNDVASGKDSSYYNAFDEKVVDTHPDGNIQYLRDLRGLNYATVLADQDTVFRQYDFRGDLVSVHRTSNNYREEVFRNAFGQDTLHRGQRGIFPFATKNFFDEVGNNLQTIYTERKDTISRLFDRGLEVSQHRNGQLTYALLEVAPSDIPLVSLGGDNNFTEKTYNQARGWLMGIKVSSATNGVVRQDWTFTHDDVGNVLERSESVTNKREYFTYNELHQMTTSQVEGQEVVDYRYAQDGALIHRSDRGEINYDGSGRPAGVGLNNDEVCPEPVEVMYTKQKQVRQIRQGQTVLYLNYGDGSTLTKTDKIVDNQHLLTTVMLPFGSVLSGRDEFRQSTYLEANGEVYAVAIFWQGEDIIQYLHRDHLGSVTAVTGAKGTVLQRFQFAPFGEARDQDWNLYSSEEETDPTAVSKHFGFHTSTGLAGLTLTGGRVLQPANGFFLSPDVAYISILPHTLNRFGYSANPVSSIDPSGYFVRWLGSQIKEHWKSIVVVTVVVAVTVATGPLGLSLSSAPLSAGLAGAAGNLTGALLNGAGVGSTFAATANGFAFGALSAGLSGSVGNLAQQQPNFLRHMGVKVVGHGMVQGTMAKAQRGSFYSGMLSGGLGGLTSPLRSPALQPRLSTRLLSAAATSSLAAHLTGGAIPPALLSGVSMQMYNEELHEDWITQQIESKINDRLNNIIGVPWPFSKFVSPFEIETLADGTLPDWYRNPSGTFLGRENGWSTFNDNGVIYQIKGLYDPIRLLNPNTMQPLDFNIRPNINFLRNGCIYRSCIGPSN